MSTGGPAAVDNGGQEPNGPTRLGGRYELGELLGIGGMAVVRLATDVRLHRKVAVKMLRGELAESPVFQARFRREARSAAALDHPAVVSVYDAGEDMVDGMLASYIVMEYVPGQTLRDALRAGPLDPRRALEITADVLGALEASHRRGIVHRDIKPANVMLAPSGEVKVMDFGVARAVTDASTSVTQTAAVVGTAHYLSPEQARGDTVDTRTDLYSTGCLLYELLTGRPPFQGDSAISVAYQHVREQAPAPSTFAPGLQPEIDAAVLSALAKRPDERYQSAGQMRAVILDLLAGRLPAAFPVSEADTTVIGRAAAASDDAWTTRETPAVDLSAGVRDRATRRRFALLLAAAVVLLAGTVGAFALNALGDNQRAGRQQAETKVAPHGPGPRASTAPSEAAAFDVTDSTTAGQGGTRTRAQPRRAQPTPGDDPSNERAVEPSPEPEQTEPTRVDEPVSSPTPSPTPEESTPADTSSQPPPAETQEPPSSTPPPTTSTEPTPQSAGTDASGATAP